MKTIRVRDIESSSAARLEPGDIIAEGIVISIVHTPKASYVFTPSATTHVSPGETIQVYGRLDPDMLPAFLETYTDDPVMPENAGGPRRRNA